MWIEIVDPATGSKVIGAVNTDACDLIKQTAEGPEGSAHIRNVNGEVYATKISYLRLIDNMTAEQAKSLVDVQADAAKPKLVTL